MTISEISCENNFDSNIPNEKFWKKISGRKFKAENRLRKILNIENKLKIFRKKFSAKNSWKKLFGRIFLTKNSDKRKFLAKDYREKNSILKLLERKILQSRFLKKIIDLFLEGQHFTFKIFQKKFFKKKSQDSGPKIFGRFNIKAFQGPLTKNMEQVRALRDFKFLSEKKIIPKFIIISQIYEKKTSCYRQGS